MSKISAPTASIAVVAILLSGMRASLAIDSAAGADNCVAAPNAAAPAGQHWYYHVDRANHRKCWYLHATVPLASQAAVQPPAAAAEPANPDPAAQPAAAPPPSQSNAASAQPAPAPENGADAAPPAPHVTVLTVKTVSAPFVDTTTQSERHPAENLAIAQTGQTPPPEENAADTSVAPTRDASKSPMQAASDVAHHELGLTIDAARAAARTKSGEMFLLLALALGIAAAFIAIVGKIAGPYRAPEFADHPDAAWMRYRTVRQRLDDEGPHDEAAPYDEQDVPFLDPQPEHGLADLHEHWTDRSSPAEAGFSPARYQDAHPAPAEPPSVKDIELALRILRQARQSRLV